VNLSKPLQISATPLEYWLTAKNCIHIASIVCKGFSIISEQLGLQFISIRNLSYNQFCLFIETRGKHNLAWNCNIKDLVGKVVTSLVETEKIIKIQQLAPWHKYFDVFLPALAEKNYTWFPVVKKMASHLTWIKFTIPVLVILVPGSNVTAYLLANVYMRSPRSNPSNHYPSYLFPWALV